MSNIVKKTENEATEWDKYGWDKDDLKLIHQTVAPNTTPAELKLFLHTAMKYDLDPLIKQVWCVKYGNNPATIFTGRDGFLALAHRSGQLDGMESEAIYDKDGKLKGAVCKVYRKDMSHPFKVYVDLKEYDLDRGLWKTKKATMIIKVAESQCLRRAFNISGLYAEEEQWYQENNNEEPAEESAEIIETADNLLEDE